jgi:hypothetical protein
VSGDGVGGQTGSSFSSESLQSLRAKRSISHEHQKTSRLPPISRPRFPDFRPRFPPISPSHKQTYQELGTAPLERLANGQAFLPGQHYLLIYMIISQM